MLHVQVYTSKKLWAELILLISFLKKDKHKSLQTYCVATIIQTPFESNVNILKLDIICCISVLKIDCGYAWHRFQWVPTIYVLSRNEKKNYNISSTIMHVLSAVKLSIWAASRENQPIRICENKDVDKLRGDRGADQRLCFRYLDSTIPTTT